MFRYTSYEDIDDDYVNEHIDDEDDDEYIEDGIFKKILNYSKLFIDDFKNLSICTFFILVLLQFISPVMHSTTYTVFFSFVMVSFICSWIFEIVDIINNFRYGISLIYIIKSVIRLFIYFIVIFAAVSVTFSIDKVGSDDFTNFTRVIGIWGAILLVYKQFRLSFESIYSDLKLATFIILSVLLLVQFKGRIEGKNIPNYSSYIFLIGLVFVLIDAFLSIRYLISIVQDKNGEHDQLFGNLFVASLNFLLIGMYVLFIFISHYMAQGMMNNYNMAFTWFDNLTMAFCFYYYSELIIKVPFGIFNNSCLLIAEIVEG